MECPARSLLRLLACGCLISAAMGDVARGEDVRPEEFRPEWKVGQKWEIETTFLQSQARRDPDEARKSKPVRWQFEIAALEEVEGQNCFRMVVRCQEPGAHPETTVWVDQNSFTLRKISMQLPGPDGFRTATESYRSTSGQPFPAISALTVPPLDLPLFLSGTKGTESFEYRASAAPEGAKGLGDLDFSVSIEQQLLQPTEEDLQQCLPEQFAKSPEKQAVIEVRLKAGRSEVRQLWKKGVPWPVYSSNGIAVSRMITDQTAPEAPNDTQEGDGQ